MPPSIVRWAFFSPARLAAVSLVVAGVVVGGVLLARSQVSPPRQQVAGHVPQSAPQPVARLSRPTATAGSGEGALGPSERVPTSVRTGMVRSARAFVDAWARDATPQPRAEWLGGVKPLTTPSLNRGLRATDPARLPRGQVSAVHLEEAGPFAGAAVVALDGGLRVEVKMVAEQDRWLVADIRPAGP